MNINIQNGDKLILVKQLYERFNFNNGNIIDMSKVDAAIQNIIIVNKDMSNIPSTIKSRFERGAKGISSDKIYISDDITIDVLFHEILHYITKEHKGILMPLINSYSEEEINKKIVAIGENLFIRQLEQLDESMTRFITELAIPEVKVTDSYKYGANVLKEYYDSIISKDIDPKFIIDMYINGSQEALEKFKNSFGDKFDDVLASIERTNNVRYYVLKQPNSPVISREEISSIIEEATSNMKIK